MTARAHPESVLRVDEPLARYTSWRVGGPARRYFRPADLADLQAFLPTLPAAEPLLWIGLGSNLLIRDGGFPGTVINTHPGLADLVWQGELLRVEAGVPGAKAARFAARHDRVGIEFLAGIPGTLGGALAMNAGAWGGETWEWVVAVETLDRRGKLRIRPASDFQVGYRQVLGPVEEWFVAAHLRLPDGDGRESLARIRRLLEQRSRTQPTGVATCGSVFRNPPGDHAARLIEQTGLKNLRIGGACVSVKHANFIVNTGGASAADLEHLMERVAAVVAEVRGIRLKREVIVVGDTGSRPLAPLVGSERGVSV